MIRFKLFKMKLILSLLLFFTISEGVWQTNFEAAQKQAKEEHKLILLNFSGSDWCGPCILFRKDILDQKVFLDMAEKNLVLVNADFPRKQKNQLPEDLVKSNNVLAEKYDRDGFFPTTVLLDAEGKVIKVWKGKPKMSAEEFTKTVETICLNTK